MCDVFKNACQNQCSIVLLRESGWARDAGFPCRILVRRSVIALGRLSFELL